MKMRRSLWRKLIVLLFAILTAVSIFITVQNYIPAISDSGLKLVGDPSFELSELADNGMYVCTIKFSVKNVTSKSVTPTYYSVKFSGVSQEQIVSSKAAIAAGATQEISEEILISQKVTKISEVKVTLKNLAGSYTIYGTDDSQGIPNYVKALIAISVILFGVFVYTCVLLYKSPKKKVHSKHKHHHHHHHHSSSSQSESSETIQK